MCKICNIQYKDILQILNCKKINEYESDITELEIKNCEYLILIMCNGASSWSQRYIYKVFYIFCRNMRIPLDFSVNDSP